ncbi:MAG: hypothetical protein IJB26_06275 [Clostridia bacterium]|nr:hypothetical protein [Clostridia bacterium]
MEKPRGVKAYDREALDRLVLQRDLAAYMRQRRAKTTEADGQKSDGESE